METVRGIYDRTEVLTDFPANGSRDDVSGVLQGSLDISEYTS